MRPASCLLLSFALAALASGAELESAEQIHRCVLDNAPDVSNVQTVELTAEDRAGGKRVVRVNIYSRIDEQGFRRVLARFTRPEDLEGAAFLLIQRESGNELIVRSPDLGSVRHIAGRELRASFGGTDFSYEDITRLQSLQRPAALKRLPDGTEAGRPAYVLESRPGDPEGSAYERIVAFVDKQTCMVTRTELYEAGDKLRKIMTAPPERFRMLGSVWVTNEVRMSDVRDGTETLLVVESFDVDAEIPAATFSVESLASPAGGEAPTKPGG